RRGGPYDHLPLDPGVCRGVGETDPSAPADEQRILAGGRDIRSGEGALDVSVSGGGQSGADDRLSALARRDAAAAKRFFRKALAQPHTVNPRTITVDKNPAYPKAVTALKQDAELWRFF